jgi:hypothetical protein
MKKQSKTIKNNTFLLKGLELCFYINTAVSNYRGGSPSNSNFGKPEFVSQERDSRVGNPEQFYNLPDGIKLEISGGLRMGVKSNGIQNTKADVMMLQRALKIYGYNVGAVDGIYGNQTKAAVTAFQERANMLLNQTSTRSGVTDIGDRLRADLRRRGFKLPETGKVLLEDGNLIINRNDISMSKSITLELLSTQLEANEFKNQRLW